MTKTKLKTNGKRYCLPILFLFIVSGCASPNKNEQLITLQRSRIQNLEIQLDKKNEIINQLKSGKWIKEPVVPDERLALKPLKKLVAEKNWIEALNESAKLKKHYNSSFRLHSYRHEIFKNMGLSKQAKEEQEILKSLHATGLKRGSKLQ